MKPISGILLAISLLIILFVDFSSVRANTVEHVGSPEREIRDERTASGEGDCTSEGGSSGGGIGGSVAIRGELQKWSPVELDFDGPTSGERDTDPHPFLDYRLQVTFVGPSGQTYNVPGFFAGDGNGGCVGNVWRARFAPDEAGQWQYTASFRTGPNVAVELALDAGTATAFDGASGVFSVADLDPNAPGFLKWGRLEYVGQHYLKFRDGPYWIKGGTDSPENFLGYAGFDNTVDQGGKPSGSFLHEYSAHVADWREGDPNFVGDSGYDAKGIIGALNYLSDQHVNSVYFLPMNLGGDGQDTYPFVGASKTAFDKTHYDISKLEQWNEVFEHAQRKGIALHIVLAETEPNNEQWLDDGEWGIERKLFFRELIARFGYLLALKWNLGEENDFPVDKLQAFADYIQALDWADHPIAVHTHLDNFQKYPDLVGDSRFSATSIQYSPQFANDYVETWRQESSVAGHPWVVDMDENGPSNIGLLDSNAADLRKQVLYDVYFSGGNLEWYFGGDDLSIGGDRTVEDFRTREEMWAYMWYARKFVQENLSFWAMEPRDLLLEGESSSYGGGQVFAKPGEVYAVYLPSSDPSGTLDLEAESTTVAFEKQWYNPRTGQFEGTSEIIAGGSRVALGSPPGDRAEDWVVLLSRTTAPPSSTPTPTPVPTSAPPTEEGVVSLTLIDAETDQPIAAFDPLVDGAVLDLASLPTQHLNIRANPSSSWVDSVRFELNGNANYRVEENPPYALAGNQGDDYHSWTPAVGQHTVTAVGYNGPNATGAVGSAVTVHFTVVEDGSVATPTPTEEPTPLPAALQISPAERTVGVGDTFDVTVSVQTGAQEVDGAAAYLNFDPAVLRVLALAPGDRLETVLQQTYDNNAGEVNYAAGTLDGKTTGTFPLVTVTFEAIGASQGSQLALNTTDPRKSDVSAGGVSVLEQVTGATVVVADSGDNRAVLDGRVTLEGRPTPPHSRWITPLELRFTVPGETEPRYTLTTETSEDGRFRVDDLDPNTYAIVGEGSHTLQRKVEAVLGSGVTTVDLGTLLEGDAVDDEIVNLLDFSTLASSFDVCAGAANYVDAADFDEDDCVTLSDFSLLSKNYGQVGDGVETARADSRAVGTVSGERAGERFTMTIEVRGVDELSIDAAELHLNFDPERLQIVEVRPGEALDTILQNHWDNQSGQLSYAAGVLGRTAPTPLTLATITFESQADVEGATFEVDVGGTRTSGVASKGRMLFWRAIYDDAGTVILEVKEAESIYLPAVYTD